MYITVRVDRPMGQAIGIKEWLAAELERFGDTRIVRCAEDDVPEPDAEQMEIDE